ncbi:MAG TPA: hypothetical protein VHV77_15020, partial [Pirellulales bacterium]|nr:hypothetical protein [Pirellulales bacterium]
IEETALAMEALTGLLCEQDVDGQSPGGARCRAILIQVDARAVGLAARRGAGWLIQATDDGRSFPPSPIGFYFAKLWYFEVLYPLIFTVAALGRVRSLLASPSDGPGVVPAVEAPSVASDG